jgi:hypothetical protein
MPKGKSWRKAELDATRARNAAMVASKHNNHRATTTDLAIAQHQLVEDDSKYRGVVTMHVDRLAAIETERDAALSSAAARSAELDAEKHMTQYQIDTLKRKLADAEANEAKLRVEVEDLKRKATESQSMTTVAVTPVRAMLPYTPAAPARDRLTAGDAYARRGGAVQGGSIDDKDEDRHLGSSGGSGGSSGERILGMSTGGKDSDGKDSCDTGVKSASQPRSVPSTDAAVNGSHMHKRPKRICQKNPPPRFSLGDAEAGGGGAVIVIDPSPEKDLSKDLSKDDDVTPTELNTFNKFNAFNTLNKFKIPSSPGLETLATEAVEERARSLSRSPSPVIPAGKSPGSVGEAVGSIPVEVEQKKRRGRPPGSGHKRKAIDKSVDDFEEEVSLFSFTYGQLD